jgi:hypothetical protein
MAKATVQPQQRLGALANEYANDWLQLGIRSTAQTQVQLLSVSVRAKIWMAANRRWAHQVGIEYIRQIGER